MKNRIRLRALMLVVAMVAIVLGSTHIRADTGNCGIGGSTLPFTDVPASNPFFCAIAEAYFSSLTNGTSSTTYSPSANVTRDQMAAFVSRTMDQSIRRSSRRAALGQFWVAPRLPSDNRGLTPVGINPVMVACDGADLWVANPTSATVSRVRASDGVKLGDWTGAVNAFGVLVALGRVFVTGETSPGTLYEIDPTQPPGPVTVVTNNLGGSPNGIAFDGRRIWTANNSGSISIVTLSPLQVRTVRFGFGQPVGIVYDGSYMLVTDIGDNTLKRVDAIVGGDVLQAVAVGSLPYFPVFDGANVWVPSFGSNSVTVFRTQGALIGTTIATLTGNGLDGPTQAAFDGERILVTNYNGNSASIWRAADLTPIITGVPFSTGPGTSPFGVCSDGVNFWIALFGANKLARF